MSSAPEIETRAEQPYVAVRAKVTMGEIAAFARRFGEVFGWLDGHGLVPAGPPFFKYNVIDMALGSVGVAATASTRMAVRKRERARKEFYTFEMSNLRIGDPIKGEWILNHSLNRAP